MRVMPQVITVEDNSLGTSTSMFSSMVDKTMSLVTPKQSDIPPPVASRTPVWVARS